MMHTTCLLGAFFVVHGLVGLVSAQPLEAGDRVACTGVAVLERVSYTISPERGEGRDKFIATLRNEGLCTYWYGNPFSIAIRKDGRWKALPFGDHCAFTSESRSLGPGSSTSKRVGWLGDWCRYRTLVPGRYRVSESVRTDGNAVTRERSRTVHAFFRVVS